MPKHFSFKIGGPAGFGIMSAGGTFSKIAVRSGYHIFDYTEYPSIVRGGHNVMQVTVDKAVVTAPVQHTDFLVALNQETIELHKNELIEGSGVLYDEQRSLETSHLPDYVNVFPIPLVKIAKDLGGLEVMRNTVALGASMALLGGKIQHLKDLIAEEFADKKPQIVEINQKVCQAGYDYALEHFGDKVKETLKPRNEVADSNPSDAQTDSGELLDKSSDIVITANEAVALGAIAAGMQFAAIYPMTPISNILHTLAPYQEKYGYVYKQPEDEISGINMALGASFAGARSMVATSGGGFCLMTEAYGLAGITETPIVIIEGMRGAPATGIPTWTEQGDLQFVLHAHQGDFPRIVLAAGDAREAFHLTMQAFNLAEKYQTPVVVMVDKMICESHQSFAPFDYTNYAIDRGNLTFEYQENFLRYADSSDGISPRTVPGSGNHFVANSDEHNPEGYSDEESANRNTQMKKRMRKLQTCQKQDMKGPIVYGPEKAEVTIVSWGSNKGSILQAMEEINASGPNVNFIYNQWMNPFPADEMRRLLLGAKYLLNIECNYSAQYAKLVKQQTGIDMLDHLLKYDGRPVYPEEIVKKVNTVISQKFR